MHVSTVNLSSFSLPGEPQFSMAACALFEQLTQNVILTARITGYTRDCPNLELYVHDQWTGQVRFVGSVVPWRDSTIHRIAIFSIFLK
jgi:hypothetical protein